MRVTEMTWAYILLILILMAASEGKKGKPKKTCKRHPTLKCFRHTYPKWSGCPNTYRCDKSNEICCMYENLPEKCNPEFNMQTGAPYSCRGRGSKPCKEEYSCFSDAKNRYSMCCENFICYDNSGNKHRKYEGEWTESDGCTICTCESNNNPKCDSSACKNVCGEFSKFSQCPDLKSCGKKIQIRKCINSDKDEVSQRNAELNMVVCHPQSPNQCPQPGVTLTEREPVVIEGSEVYPKFNYRWMVHIFGYTYCGGTILSPHHILTAAHCFYYYDIFGRAHRMSISSIRRGILVKTGKHQLSVEEPLEQVATIKDVTIHENYDKYSLDNDIAIVTLDAPLQFNNRTHPINLPTSKIFDRSTISKLRKGLCKVIGWGATNGTVKDSKSDLLLEVALNLQNSCLLSLESDKQKVTHNMFCASAKNPNKTHGHKRLDSCFGDSDGPFMCREAKQWYQYGIVSWGPGNLCGNQSGVYTKVSNYLEWIKEIISTPGDWGEFSGYSPCSVSCGGGIKSRVKACTNPFPIGNGICPGYNFKMTDGEMVYVEDEACNTEPCG